MAKGYVLYSQELGVFLSEFMGFGLWSKLDPCGQPAAVVFPSKEEAARYAPLLKQDTLEVIEVEVDAHGHALMENCVAAGLPAWSIGKH